MNSNILLLEIPIVIPKSDIQWRRKMFSIGGAGLALWCLSDESSSILVAAGGRLLRGGGGGEFKIKTILLHFEPISTISLINLSS